MEPRNVALRTAETHHMGHIPTEMAHYVSRKISSAVSQVFQELANAQAAISRYTSNWPKGVVKTQRTIVRRAEMVAHFVKQNRFTLLAYAVAWGVILCSIGMMHGFGTTTKPFSIGMSVGFGFGFLIGSVRSQVFHSKNSIGGTISTKATDLLDVTTRTMAITVFVAIYLIVATRLPHAIGGITGLVIGEHIIIKAFSGAPLQLGPDRSLHDKLEKVEKTLERERGKRREMQNTLARAEQLQRRYEKDVTNLQQLEFQNAQRLKSLEHWASQFFNEEPPED